MDKLLAKFKSNIHNISSMALFYESEAQLWAITFLLLGVVYPIIFFLLVWKADKPEQVDPKEVLENEEKALF